MALRMLGVLAAALLTGCAPEKAMEPPQATDPYDSEYVVYSEGRGAYNAQGATWFPHARRVGRARLHLV